MHPTYTIKSIIVILFKVSWYNPQNDRLAANHTGVEGNETNLDFVSNGIVLRDTANGHLNYSGYSYVAFAIGQTMVGTNDVPATAR